MSSVASDVKGLVNSIKKHKKFRQLASYSVQCLQKVIMPPRSGWERNMKEAFKAGAGAAILDVIKRHKGDKAVVSSATGCLSSIATNAEAATSLAKSGIVSVMAQALKANPSGEGADEVVALLRNVTAHAPDEVVASGGIEELAEVVQATKSTSPKLVAAMSQCLEKCSRGKGGPERIVRSSAMTTLLDVAEDRQFASDPATAESILKLTDRIAKDEGLATAIRDEHGGLQRLTRTLDLHRNNDRVCRVGGRLLSRMASSNIPQLVEQLQSDATPPAEREFVADLLCNLALEEDNAEALVRAGGLSSLLKAMDSTANEAAAGAGGGSPGGAAWSSKLSATAARALGRVATHSHLAEGIGPDGIAALCSNVGSEAVDQEVVAASLGALRRMAGDPASAEALRLSRARERVTASLQAHPGSVPVAKEGLGFLEKYVVAGNDVEELVAEGGIGLVLQNMEGCRSSAAVQVEATRLLVYMCSSEENMRVLLSREGLLDQLTGNIHAACQVRHKVLEGVGTGTDNRLQQVNASKLVVANDLTQSTMYLLTSLCCDEGQREALASDPHRLDVLLGAVSQFREEPAVRVAGEELIELLSSADQTLQFARRLSALVKAVLEGGRQPAEASVKLAINAAKGLSSLMIVPTNAQALVSCDEVLPAMGRDLQALAGKNRFEGQRDLLEALLTILEVVQGAATSMEDGETMLLNLEQAEVPKAVCAAVKLQAREPAIARRGLNLVQIYARHAPEEAMANGVGEACVACLRSNAGDAHVVQLAAGVVTAACAHVENAAKMAKSGATRYLLESIEANAGDSGFGEAMAQSLDALQAVASTDAGAEELQRQAAAATIMTAMDAAVGRVSASSTVGSSSTKLLARLMQSSDVVTSMESLERMAEGKASAASAVPMLSQIGHLAGVGRNAETIVQSGGDRMVMDMTQSLLARLAKAEQEPSKKESASKREKREQEAEELRAAIPTAISAIAGLTAAVELSHESRAVAVTSIAASMSQALAVDECLAAVAAAATSSAETAELLLDQDGGAVVQSTISTLQSAGHNEQRSKACFDALAALAQASPENAGRVTEGGELVSATISWIDDNADDAKPEAVSSAYRLLKATAANPEVAQSMLTHHVLSTVRQTVAKAVQDGEQPAVMAQGMRTVAAMMRSAAGNAIQACNSSGLVRRSWQGVMRQAALLQNGDLCAATLEMLTAASADAEVATELVRMGAQEFIVAAMNANGTHQEVLQQGAAALQAMGDTVNVRDLVAEVDRTAVALETAEEFDEAMVASVANSVQRLGNFMMMEGMVTTDNAHDIMQSVSRAVALVSESRLASEEQTVFGLQCLSRLATLAPDGDLSEAVESVLDVLALHDSSALVATTAVECLGMMANNQSAVRSMLELQVEEEVAKIAQRHAGTSAVEDACRASISTISAAATESLANVGGEGGAEDMAASPELLVSVINMSAADPTQLEKVLTNCLQNDHGPDAMWTVLEAGLSQDLASMSHTAGLVFSRLADHANPTLAMDGEAEEVVLAAGPGQRFPGTSSRGTAAAVAMKSAIAAREVLTEQSGDSERRTALRRNMQALALASSLDYAREGADAFVEAGGLGALMQLMAADMEEELYAPYIMYTVMGIAQAGGPSVHAALANAGDLDLLAECAIAHQDNSDVAYYFAHTLNVLVRAQGPHGANVSRHAHQALQDLAARHSGNQQVHEWLSDTLALLEPKFSASAETALMAGMTQAVAAIEEAAVVQAEWVEARGEWQFHNAATGEVTAECAQFTRMQQQLADTAQMVADKTADTMVEFSSRQIASVVKALENNAVVPDVLEHSATILSAASVSQDNCRRIAKGGGIRAVIAAMDHQRGDPQVIEKLLTLLERLSRNDEFKAMIVAHDGLALLVSICKSPHANVPSIADKAMATLANLAFTSTSNIAGIVRADGVAGIEHVMQCHPNNAQVLENAMCALSNLTWESPSNMLLIGQKCGDEVTQVIRDFQRSGNRNPGLVKMALRALGNVSNEDDNVRMVVFEEKASLHVSNAMRTFQDDDELVTLAIEVLGNCCAAHAYEDEDNDEDDDQREDSVQQFVYAEGGTEKVLEAMKAKADVPAIQTAGLFMLATIMAHAQVAKLMEDSDVAETACAAFERHLSDRSVVVQACEFVEVLEPRPYLQRMLERNIFRLLSDAMEVHRADPEVVMAVSAATNHLAAVQAVLPEISHTIMSLDLPSLLLRHLQDSHSNPDLCVALLEALMAIATDEDAAKAIADVGMHILIRVLDEHVASEAVMIPVLHVVDLIALNRDNITYIVQAEGINALLAVFNRHFSRPLVIAQAVKTLATISNANTEFADLMRKEGAIEVFQMAIDQHEAPADASQDNPIFGVILSGSPADVAKALRKDPLNLKDLAVVREALDTREVRELTPAHERASAPEATAEDTDSFMDLQEAWGKALDAAAQSQARLRARDSIRSDCRAAIVMMEALDGINKSAKLTSSAARSKAVEKRDELADDPLGEYRHSLTAGKQMRVWHKRKSEIYRIVVSPDLRQLVWEAPRTQAKKGAVSIARITEIQEGLHATHHPKPRRAKGTETCCFYIESPEGTLALEANSSTSKASFMRGLQRLVDLTHEGRV